jgi:ECF transporter S component (folate family)
MEVCFMKKQNKKIITTQVLANCALLAALSVVLARLIAVMPNESTRFSIEAIPIFLAGMLFGPIPGAMVGFAADFVGCLFSGYGYNPIFCVPPILYGLSAGLFRYYLCAKPNLLRITLGWLPPVVLGSVLYQSATLAWVYGKGLFFENFVMRLGLRIPQFAVTLVLDVLIVFFLCKTSIFKRMGLWPERKETT